MGKGVRIGIVVEAVVLIVAIALSIAYFQTGLFKSDKGLDIWLLILWVLVAAVLLVVLWWRSTTREEMVRRFYLSESGVYNHEIGYAPFDRIAPDMDSYEFVAFAADSLAEMSYGFEVADVPDDFKPTRLILTRVLHFHRSEDGEEGGAVVDQWEGSLVSVENPSDEKTFKELGTYKNARELARLLEDDGLFL